MSAGTAAELEKTELVSARQEHIPLAIFYMVISGVVFTASSAASKWLIATYPIGEVLFVRTATAQSRTLTVSRCFLPSFGWVGR